MDKFSTFIETINEKAAFEKAIDDNPVDANTHLVYADWLDENDEKEEAGLQRELGKWLINKPDVSANWPGHEDFKYRVRTSDLPQWADWYVPRFLLNGLYGWDERGRPRNFNSIFIIPGYYAAIDQYHIYGWHTYRDMEEGMRRAFKVSGKARA